MKFIASLFLCIAIAFAVFALSPAMARAQTDPAQLTKAVAEIETINTMRSQLAATLWKLLRRSLILSLLFGLLILTEGIVIPHAIAAVYTLEEAPGQMLHQSRHTLRDETGQPWQVMLFKREKANAENSLHLRLVGFPNVVAFDHPQPLKVFASPGKVWLAEDIFANKSPAENVGEFDFQEVLPKLPPVALVQLLLKMKDDRAIALQIPAEVVLEWHLISNPVNGYN